MSNNSDINENIFDVFYKYGIEECCKEPFFLDIKFKNFTDDNYFGFQTKIVNKIKELPHNVASILLESKFVRKCILLSASNTNYFISIDFYANYKKEFNCFINASAYELITYVKNIEV